MECGTDSTKINVLCSLISAQPGFVLPTEAAEDAPIWDATRVRVTSISVQRESFCVYRLQLFNIFPLASAQFIIFPTATEAGNAANRMDATSRPLAGHSIAPGTVVGSDAVFWAVTSLRNHPQNFASNMEGEKSARSRAARKLHVGELCFVPR